VSKEFDTSLKVHAKLDTGFDFDTAVILGGDTLEDLGIVYTEIQRDLAKATIINISNSVKNTRFGSVNVIDPTSDSISQLIIKKAPLWELNITTQAAQALLLGITQK
jgi:nanoRNase/pAp phosphatase (c-di-AMP/oligoRNAs hydrolase)